jgi:hypothetical protein
MRLASLLALVLSLPALPLAAQSRDDARIRDVEAVQADLRNLDDELRRLEPDDPKTDEFRRRAQDITEDAIYLKVKARRHRDEGGTGSGVTPAELEALQRSIRELRGDIERSFGGGKGESARDVRLAAGTEISVQLGERLSSKTARLEDPVTASVFRPVRAEGALALPAGTRVRGVVVDVEAAQRPSKGGRLEILFDRIDVDGERVDFRGRVTSIDQGSDTGKTAGKAGLGAVIGGVLGGILGGGKGAVVGVIVGGTGAVVGTKGDEVELPAGTVLTVRLEEPLRIDRHR